MGPDKYTHGFWMKDGEAYVNHLQCYSIFRWRPEDFPLTKNKP